MARFCNIPACSLDTAPSRAAVSQCCCCGKNTRAPVLQPHVQLLQSGDKNGGQLEAANIKFLKTQDPEMPQSLHPPTLKSEPSRPKPYASKPHTLFRSCRKDWQWQEALQVLSDMDLRGRLDSIA